MSGIKQDNGQMRLIRIVEELAAHTVYGMASKDLIARLGYSAPQLSRDMGLLELCGWVERRNNAAWRLTPRFGRIAQEISQGFRSARLELMKDEVEYIGEDE